MEKNDPVIDAKLLAAAIEVRDASRFSQNSRSIETLMREVIELLKLKDETTLAQIMAECNSKQTEPDDEYVVISNAAMAITA